MSTDADVERVELAAERIERATAGLSNFGNASITVSRDSVVAVFVGFVSILAVVVAVAAVLVVNAQHRADMQKLEFMRTELTELRQRLETAELLVRSNERKVTALEARR